MKKQTSDPQVSEEEKGEKGERGDHPLKKEKEKGKGFMPLFKRRKSLEPGKLEAGQTSPSSSPFSIPFFTKKSSASPSSSPRSGGSPRTPSPSTSPSNSKEHLPISQETRAPSPSMKPARHSSSSLSHVRHSGSSLNLATLSSSPAPAPGSPKTVDELEGYGLLAEVFRRNGGALVLLADYCERNFCEEVVHCYQLILDFRNPAHVADGELPLRARTIYESFLMPGCSREVNVSHDSIAGVSSTLRNPLYRTHLTSPSDADASAAATGTSATQQPLPRSTFDAVMNDLAPLLLHLLLDLKHSQPQRFQALLKGDFRILPSSSSS